MSAFEPVRAVLRGLEVLRVVSESGPLTASEIARTCKLPQPTAVRLLETLIAAGYVYRHPSQQVYGVTARTKSLGRGYDARSRLVQLAEPLIEELRAEIGWPSNLAVFEERSMVVAYTNRNATGMPVLGRLGAHVPFLATGVGIVYLASVDSTERKRILGLLRKSPERWDTEPSLWKTLDARIAEARKTGHAFAEEVYLDAVYQSRIWAVAVPIKVAGEPVAAVSSLVLRTAGERQQQLAFILPPLERTARRIGELLEADRDGTSPGDAAQEEVRRP